VQYSKPKGKIPTIAVIYKSNGIRSIFYFKSNSYIIFLVLVIKSTERMGFDISVIKNIVKKNENYFNNKLSLVKGY
jgi:hypothetical protein